MSEHEQQQEPVRAEGQDDIAIQDQQQARPDSQLDRSANGDADEDSQPRSRTPSALNASHNKESAKGSERQNEGTSGAPEYRRSNWAAESRGNTHEQQYRRSGNISPHLQSSYDKTQQVLAQARARSREQVFMHPSNGNGYEKHNGSPQRGSPKREQYEQPAHRVSYNGHIPERQSFQQSSSYRRVDHSPLQETHNMRREEPLQQQVSHADIRQRSSGKENSQRMAHHAHTASIPQIRHNSTSATRVIEHSKQVTATTQGVASIKSAENIHDQIIASYRRQLQNSANLDNMYEQLKLRIAEVAQRKTQMEDSIRYLQSDYEKQIEQQTRDSELLQNDLENLKRQNADLGQECTTTNSDIMDAKTQLNQRDMEVQRIRQDIQRSQDEGRFIKENIDDAKRQLSMNYQTKEQQHQKIFQLTAQLKQNEQNNFVATSDSNNKTTELNNLKEQVRRLNDTLHHKSVTMEDASTKFEIARAEQVRNQTETGALQKDCENANQRNSFLLETQRQLVRQKDAESGRSAELNTDITRAESTYLQNDNELQAFSRELEAIRKSNESLLEAGHCYKQELHALQNHADLLALQNNDLQKELDEFVMTDEIIRSGLDRKGRVNHLKDTNQVNERQSYHEVVKSRSPTRKSASRSPLRQTTNTVNHKASSSLTQQYLNYHQTQQQQQNVSIQDLCRQQLQENMRQEQAQAQEKYLGQGFNMRNHQQQHQAERSQSPQYRARNGSPLRKA